MSPELHPTFLLYEMQCKQVVRVRLATRYAPAPLLCEQELPAVCQYTKFEERSFIRDKDMAHFPSKD